MAKEKQEKSKFVIFKSKSYDRHTILLDLDKERADKFNKFEQITVTQDELDLIGSHRWLEVKNEQKDISEDREVRSPSAE